MSPISKSPEDSSHPSSSSPPLEVSVRGQSNTPSHLKNTLNRLFSQNLAVDLLQAGTQVWKSWQANWSREQKTRWSDTTTCPHSGCTVGLLGVVGCLVGLLVVLVLCVGLLVVLVLRVGLLVVLVLCVCLSVEIGFTVVVCLACWPRLMVRPHRPQGGWTHRPQGTRSKVTSMDAADWTIKPTRESRKRARADAMLIKWIWTQACLLLLCSLTASS